MDVSWIHAWVVSHESVANTALARAALCRGYMWNKTLKLFQNYFNDIEHVENY